MPMPMRREPLIGAADDQRPAAHLLDDDDVDLFAAEDEEGETDDGDPDPGA
jgi:hypothetical protein